MPRLVYEPFGGYTGNGPADEYAVRFLRGPAYAETGGIFCFTLHGRFIFGGNSGAAQRYAPGGGGYHQDILLTPPDEYFDIVFFFKEAHRFEKRKKGCLRSFFEKLNTSLLVVSLPVKNMDGRVNSKSSQDRLIGEAIDTAGDKLEVIDHYGERLYFIHKKNA